MTGRFGFWLGSIVSPLITIVIGFIILAIFNRMSMQSGKPLGIFALIPILVILYGAFKLIALLGLAIFF